MRWTAVLLAKQFTKAAIKATEKELEFKAPWGKLTALSWGDPANPPLVFCHGRLDTCSSFRRLLQHLPDDRYYVSLDLPGNGLSDPLPLGARYNIVDFVFSLVVLREHFDWRQFDFIGHSLGAAIGKYYNAFYPGHISRLVELDPQPAYLSSVFKDMRSWYMFAYDQFYRKFDKHSTGADAAPKYPYEEIRRRMMEVRGVDEEVADDILERCLAPTEDGLFRLTYDQRMKIFVQLPLPAEEYRKIYVEPKTPTLAIFAKDIVAMGAYSGHTFALNDSEWPHGNYRSVVMDGGHDIHLQHPEKVGQLVTEFLEESKDVKRTSQLA